MAHDYRYFPEPDLPPLQLDRGLVEGIRSSIPELPQARAARFSEQYGLSAYDAGVLTSTRADADTYEALVGSGVSAKVAANWQMGEVAALANEHHTALADSGLGISGLAALLTLLEEGVINGSTAKGLLAELYMSGGDAAALIAERGLGQVGDTAELGQVISDVIEANPKACADFRGGHEPALQSLVGQVMKATRGRADARLVTTMLRERLST
jgi:aspartyl-tRNA(Asn)/glutamyl-tRNA(Gln) amidotransferase subunit B